MISGIEYVSMAAGVVIIMSAIPKNQLHLRIMSAVGSLLLAIYGILLLIKTNYATGHSTIVLNTITLTLSIYHTIRIIRNRKKGIVDKGQ